MSAARRRTRYRHRTERRGAFKRLCASTDWEIEQLVLDVARTVIEDMILDEDQDDDSFSAWEELQHRKLVSSLAMPPHLVRAR